MSDLHVDLRVQAPQLQHHQIGDRVDKCGREAREDGTTEVLRKRGHVRCQGGDDANGDHGATILHWMSKLEIN